MHLSVDFGVRESKHDHRRMPEESEDVIFLDIKPNSRTGLGFPADEASQKRARLLKLEQVRPFSRASARPGDFSSVPESTG